MGANDTAALVVALSAQLTKFEKDMTDAEGLADRSVKRIESSFSKINPGAEGVTNFLTKLATAGGVAAAVTQLKAMVAEVANLGESAERVGLSVEEFQKFRFAIIATGGAVENADGFLNRFSRSMSEAGRGAGELYKTLLLNKVVIKDSSDNLLPQNILLGKFADLVKNAKNPQDQLNLAMLAGGRQAGPALVEALKRGADGLREFGDEADRVGVILDDALVRRAKQINKEWDILWERLKTGSKTAAVAIAEALDEGARNANTGMKAAATDIKSIWDSIVEYIETHSPRAANILGNIQELFQDEQRRIIREGPRTGSDIGAALGGGKVDSRFNPAPVISTGETKLFNEQADSFRKMIEAQERRIALLDAERQGVGQLVGFTEQLKTKIQLESEAKSQNLPLTAERIAKIDEESRKMGAAAQALDDYKRHWQGIQSAVQFAGSQLVDVFDAIGDKTKSMADVAQSAFRAIKRSMLEALITGQGALGGLFGTASRVPGGTGGLLGLLFGGFRAEGGPVSPNKGYWVGERGPEWFQPKQTGSIIPNSVTLGSGGGNIVVNIHQSNSYDSNMSPADMAQIRAMNERTKAETVQLTIDAIRKGQSNDSSFINRGG